MVSRGVLSLLLLCAVVSHKVHGHSLEGKQVNTLSDVLDQGFTTQEESELNEISLPSDPTDEPNTPEDDGGNANEANEANEAASSEVTTPEPSMDESAAKSADDSDSQSTGGSSSSSSDQDASDGSSSSDDEDDEDFGDAIPTMEPIDEEAGEGEISEESSATDSPADVNSGEAEVAQQAAGGNSTSNAEATVDDEDAEANAFEEEIRQVVKRRRRSERHLVLSTKDHPLIAVLVTEDESNEHHRVKRTSFNISKSTWPQHIPYIIDPDFPAHLRHQLHAVLNFLMNRLCVEFQEEPEHDVYNANWFKEKGYTTNAYIRFYERSVCAALYGRGSRDQGPRKITPCTQFFSMMHEVIHSLGGIHSQNYPYRERYITLHDDNIARNGRHNYRKTKKDSSEVEYEEFDPSSLLMYANTYFTKTGLSTFDYIRPDMQNLYGPSSYDNIFMEINKNYKCQETKCADEDRDCGPGYLGFVNKQCACVCPAGFNPATRCKEVMDAPETGLSWPDTSFSLYKAEECPDGMEDGSVTINLPKKPLMKGVKLSYKKNTLNLDMCSKTSSAANDFESWPVGTYCIVKAKDVACDTPFQEGAFEFAMKTETVPEGEVGDISVDGKSITIKYCCRSEGDIRFPMKLPTDTAFRLTSNYYYCQPVDGMWAINGIVWLRTKASHTGKGPQGSASARKGLKQYSCYYQPPTYGCSQEVMLDAGNPSVTITAPMTKGREANKRCFYYFQAPEGSRLRITFNKVSLDKNDLVLLKRYNLLENPQKIDVANPPHQLITEKHQMQMEYWTYMKASSRYKGLDFTVDLLAAEDFCYDAETQGADYAGSKDIAETYEGCVPWEQATQCPDFPWSGTNALHLLNSGKSCRNLDTVGMLQPWCYGYVKGTMCTRRYCDVCNQAEPVDKLEDCAKFIADDPNFCTDSVARFGCFKSCGMDTETYDKSAVTCGKPVIPEGLSADGLADSYEVGSTVAVTCGGQDTQIECTSLGWSPFDDACTASACVDASQLCENTISKYAEFCTNELSKEAAERFCKKSCGLCNQGSCDITSGASYTVEGGVSSVAVGGSVQLVCNDGLHFNGGDLNRACSPSGELLGEEPLCDATPLPTDVNADSVYKKKGVVAKTYAYLMLGDGLDVPFDGKITKWFYYCSKDSSLTLLVYRKTGDSTTFELVGSNEAECVPMWPWSHAVPAGDQISVQKGDILGVYDPKGSVNVAFCKSAPEKIVPIASVKSKKVSGITGKKTLAFNKPTCGHISLGARVEPN